MLRKVLLASVLTAMTLAPQLRAEEARALLTTENKFPELGQLELSYLLDNQKYDDLDYRAQSLIARYGLIENLTARLQLPYVQREPDFGSDTDGLGDIRLGFDLKAFEDIFRYPYVIPHADVIFSTGDEDDGLGSGETGYSFGVSVGTVVYEVLHYVVDISYTVDADAKVAGADDMLTGSLSIIWDMSDRFSVMGEARAIDYDNADATSILAGLGMSYAWTENFGTTIFVGGWPDAEMGEDQNTMVKASYTF